MTDRSEKVGEDKTMFTDWEKMFNDHWGPLFHTWNDFFQQSGDQDFQKNKGRVTESLHSNLKMWQTMMGAASGPDSLAGIQKATEMTPDLVLGFAQTCLQGLTSLQTKANDWVEKRGGVFSEADIQELDRELLKTWRDTYEKEFSRYLKLPQIGLTRLYQERAFAAADKMNTFQLELAEYLHLLYLPIEQSLRTVQEKMTEMADDGPLDEKSKTYYNLWIKVLEGHYMELFQTSEYTEAMHKTLYALHEYSNAKQAVINDTLKQLNIPTAQDLDELSKEIYLLKKRVRELEKK